MTSATVLAIKYSWLGYGCERFDKGDAGFVPVLESTDPTNHRRYFALSLKPAEPPKPALARASG
jgi:hypothetical protein